MKSFVHFRRGETPRQAHRDLDGLKEEELGRQGFAGRVAMLYRREEPKTRRVVGDYRLREADAGALLPEDLSDPRGRPLLLLHNDDCRILLSRRSAAMPYFFRSVDADTLHFVHRGTGRCETEFGPLAYEPGDYLALPKAVTYRIVPDTADNVFFVLETNGEMQLPDGGILGRHAPFDPTLLTVPEPEPRDAGGRREWEVVVEHQGERTSLFYDFDPCAVVGWKGDLFPWKLNIRDWNVVLSDTLHLPPSVHQFLAAPGVVVVHFLPRPAEGREGTERLPWYHRNADCDEVILYHGGDFLGMPLPAGRISHSPQGIHHGPPERAREHARRTHHEVSRVEWQMISFDVTRPLTVSDAFRAVADKP